MDGVSVLAHLQDWMHLEKHIDSVLVSLSESIIMFCINKVLNKYLLIEWMQGMSFIGKLLLLQCSEDSLCPREGEIQGFSSRLGEVRIPS